MNPISSNQPIRSITSSEHLASSKGINELPTSKLAAAEQKSKPEAFYKDFDKLLTISIKPDAGDQKAAAAIAPFIFLSDQGAAMMQTFKTLLKT